METPVEPEAAWPPAERFPLNVSGRSVRQRVVADLAGAGSPLIVTGYAGLEQLIRLEGELTSHGDLRILFGNEPSVSERRQRSLVAPTLSEEVEQYWLDQGISLRLSARLVHFRERLREGAIRARIWPGEQRPLHAKLYAGAGAVTVGSSNFSGNGLEYQHEANARFTEQHEPRRWRETAALAETYWEQGRDYTEELLTLLDSLLHKVGWREALARACAELLEGEWARGFLRQADPEAFRALWPSQRQGIAQALYLLDRQGAVLVADATGSGKTRMGTHLLRAQQARLQGMGRMPRTTLVAPRAIVDEWEVEALKTDLPLEVLSEGKLSRGKQRARIDEALRRTRLLAVDECHHFHNHRSRRTQRLFNHLADDVVLFTATPINRDADDLIRVADILGADNLQPSTLEALERMARRGHRTGLDRDEARQLRDEIRTFSVRRTKRMLNTLIDREPAAYRDATGRLCRYPDHRAESYQLGETPEDREAARRIREQLDTLYGVLQIRGQRLQPSAFERRQGLTEEQYRDRLLAASPALVRHRILAALRSSRPALVEHLCGTSVAREEFGLQLYRKNHDTGAILERLATPLPMPENHLSVSLPEWLTDPEAWQAACAHDHAVLTAVLEEVRAMGPAREQAKVDQLARLTERHDRVLAFDSCLITLAYLHEQLAEAIPERTVWQATATDDAEREAVLDAFRPGGQEAQGVALCSDSLAEGVNLQAASAVVHLDMPSVIRMAEQRTGRVDRMDSPHPEVEVWWPRDAPEFSLLSDERFVGRVETVTELLGTNLPLPADLQQRARETVDAETLIEEYEARARRTDEAEPEDAFARVRALVEGTQALVDAETYEHYRQRAVRVLSRVSVVESQERWAFFCLAGNEERAPRWFFFPGLSAEPLTNLDTVAKALRQRLSVEPPDAEMDEESAEWLGRFVDRLPEAERQQLPLRKQRALEEMERVLDGFRQRAAREQDQPRVDAYGELRDLLRREPAAMAGGEPDWEALADGWLELIRPYWHQRLAESRRGPMRLKLLRTELIEAEPELGPEVRERFSNLPLRSATEDQIVAAILGVPST